MRRPRLALHYHPYNPYGTGHRPVLALHRRPDPACPDCGGRGSLTAPVTGSDEPEVEPCDCYPPTPLAALRLPTWVDRWRRRRAARVHGYPDEPPF